MPPSILMKSTCRAVACGSTLCCARTLSGRKASRNPPTRLTPPTRSSSRRVREGMFRSLRFMALRASIVEDEIQLVQQAPVQILGALLAILVQPRHRKLLLLRRRVARQRRQVQLVDDLRVASWPISPAARPGCRSRPARAWSQTGCSSASSPAGSSRPAGGRTVRDSPARRRAGKSSPRRC